MNVYFTLYIHYLDAKCVIKFDTTKCYTKVKFTVEILKQHFQLRVHDFLSKSISYKLFICVLLKTFDFVVKQQCLLLRDNNDFVLFINNNISRLLTYATYSLFIKE